MLADGAQATWVDPTGNEWPLTVPSLGWFTTNAVSGLGAIPTNMTTDPAPRGGTVIRHFQPAERIITWPLHIYGTTHAEFVSRFRSLAEAFTRTDEDGAGRLVIARPDGSARWISAYHQDGFTGEPGRGYLDDDVALTLYCPQPWWNDMEETVIRREYALAGTYLNPYPTVSSSQLLGQTDVSNPGNAIAYPVWRITGPASLVTITNDSTGEEFVIDPNAAGIAHGNLLAGETVTVTTDEPSVRGPADEIWTGALNWPDAVLWGLKPGLSSVTFTVAGSSSGTTIELSFHARHRTA